MQPGDLAERPRAVRILWAGTGLLLVGVGTVGIFVPGLPVVGPLVRDYRDGLGMPRRSKIVAVALMWTACTISAVTVRDRWWLAMLILVLGAVGTVVVVWRVPTRERVLAARALATDQAEPGNVP